MSHAASGPDGLQCARDLHPDLIVLDLMLPGLDGFDLLGTPGPVSYDLHFDQGAHWGGESDREDAEIAGWTLGPIALASLIAVAMLGLAWRRRPAATG